MGYTRSAAMKRCLFLICIAACGGSQAAKTTAPQPTAKSDDPTCPLLVPGTSMSVEDTSTGAALVFVTTGDAAAVRTRAVALAAMHNKRDGSASSMGMMFSPTSTATSTDIEGGARIEFAATSEGDAGKLQGELRMHAGHLTGGTCEM
jgi:hypothetical protein